MCLCSFAVDSRISWRFLYLISWLALTPPLSHHSHEVSRIYSVNAINDLNMPWITMRSAYAWVYAHSLLRLSSNETHIHHRISSARLGFSFSYQFVLHAFHAAKAPSRLWVHLFSFRKFNCLNGAAKMRFARYLPERRSFAPRKRKYVSLGYRKFRYLSISLLLWSRDDRRLSHLKIAKQSIPQVLKTMKKPPEINGVPHQNAYLV